MTNYNYKYKEGDRVGVFVTDSTGLSTPRGATILNVGCNGRGWYGVEADYGVGKYLARREEDLRPIEKENTAKPGFEIGDRVQITCGSYKGEFATITDVCINDIVSLLPDGARQKLSYCMNEIIKVFKQEENTAKPERKKEMSNQPMTAEPIEFITGISDNKSDKRIKAASRYSRLTFWGAIVFFSGLGNFAVSKTPSMVHAIGEFLIRVSGQ